MAVNGTMVGGGMCVNCKVRTSIDRGLSLKRNCVGTGKILKTY